MEENHKRIVKNSAYMYIRMIFIMLISLYTSRVVLEVLGVEDFGIYSLVGGIVSIFTVMSGSLSGSVQRFLNIGLGERDLQKTQTYFAQSLTIFVFIFIAFLVIGESLGAWFIETRLNIPSGREEATFWVYQFSLVAVLFSVLQIPFSGAVTAREHFGFFTLIGIADVSLRLIVVILLDIYATPDNLIVYALLIAVIQILQTMAYVAYAGMKFKECVFKLQWNSLIVKELLSFMGLSFWGNSIVTITNQGINVIINLFGGAALNAATGVAQRVNVAVVRMVDCISTPIKPQIVKSYAAKDYKQMLLLFEKNTKYSFLFMLMLLFPLILEAEFILDIWLKDVPDYAVLFTQIVLVESLFSVFAYGMQTVVRATGKLVKMELIGRFITLAVLPVAYILLKSGTEPYWALVISLCSQIVYVCYLLDDVRSKVDMDMMQFFRNALKPVFILVAVLSLLCIPEYIFIEEGIIRFFLVGFTVVLVGCATIWFFCLDSSEKQFVKRFFKIS